jgi:hypothetical protein
MNDKKILPTWSGRCYFRYSGSVKTGIIIEFGANYKNNGEFKSTDLSKLIDHFSGTGVPLGTQHTSDPVRGSVAEWIRKNVNKNRIMTSYLGPILVSEGYAERNGKMIKF